jgi:large subunit ribosomal protein L9
MKVVLLEDVKGTGKAGETHEVRDGYARNFLLPRRLALAATRGAVESMERQRQAESRRAQREVEEAEALRARLEKLNVTLTLRTGKDGKPFGAVTNADIASALKQQHGIAMDRRKIALAEPIKALGPARAEVRLHREVTARLPLQVTSG